MLIGVDLQGGCMVHWGENESC